MPDTLQVSLSAFQVWQRCEQKYAYSYVERLRRREQAAAPELGQILHEYLEAFYKEVKRGLPAQDAHSVAQLHISVKYLPEIRGYVNVAFFAGNEDLAKELEALPARAEKLTNNYFRYRGREDADRHEIIQVETRESFSLARGITSVGIVDLVTKDRATGRTHLWEHKSTTSIPPANVRLLDFQTLLYSAKVRYKFDIDSIIWNYIRTKQPTIPELVYKGTKRESLSRASNIDSTWDMYVETCNRLGLDERAYYDMRERLEGRELTIFFPRYEAVTVVDEDVLLGDYIEESKRIRAARRSWAKGESRPIRTLERDCEYFCDYFRICQAVLTGGDAEDVIRMNFERYGAREETARAIRIV